MPVIDEKQELAKKTDLATKQDILTPGTGITIQNNVISATGAGGSTVTVTPVLSTGTRIAAMEVDGTIYTLFAPTPPSVGVTQVVDQGVELARVTIDGVATSIYAPESSTVLSGTSAPSSSLGEDNNLYVQYTVTSGVYTVDMTYVKLSGAWVELSAGGGTGNVDDVYVNGTSVLDSNKIAQITSYREVTQAEYDALPASKESDGVLYCIKDKATADTTVAPIIYSEEEREVGVWTDGKPLYQKTVDCGYLPNRTTKSVSFEVNNIDKILYINGIAYYSSGGHSLPLPYCDDASSTGNILVDANSNGTIRLICQADRSAYYGYVTLQYTKTTDTPGSGKYAPSGVPAVHYSENEQVVGTWVDGNTVYEKVYLLSSQLIVYNNNWTDSGISKIGIDLIIGAFGVDTNDKSKYELNTYIGGSGSEIQLQACRATSNAYINVVVIRYTKQTS